MAASTNIPTKLKKSQVVNAGPQLKFDTDTLGCLLVKAGSGIPSTTSGGIQFVADITGTNAEVSGTGYSRQTLSSVTVAFDGGVNTYVDFSFGDVTFTQSAGGTTVTLVKATWTWVGQVLQVNAKTMLTLVQRSWKWQGQVLEINAITEIMLALQGWVWRGQPINTDRTAKLLLLLRVGH